MAAASFFPPETSFEGERERLILEHIPQVRLIARKIHERVPESICFDDLLSAGVIGLINAIDHFDASQKVRLKTYAEFRIRGAILDSLRETDWAPRLKRRQTRVFEAAMARAEQRLGRMPEEAEIAAELNLTLDDYRQKLTDLKHVPANDRESPALRLERAELERMIASAIERIPKVEKTVLSLYFFEELTLREIAEMMGIHLSRASQIKSQAILRLRTAMFRHRPGLSM